MVASSCASHTTIAPVNTSSLAGKYCPHRVCHWVSPLMTFLLYSILQYYESYPAKRKLPVQFHFYFLLPITTVCSIFSHKILPSNCGEGGQYVDIDNVMWLDPYEYLCLLLSSQSCFFKSSFYVTYKLIKAFL